MEDYYKEIEYDEFMGKYSERIPIKYESKIRKLFKGMKTQTKNDHSQRVISGLPANDTIHYRKPDGFYGHMFECVDEWYFLRYNYRGGGRRFSSHV